MMNFADFCMGSLVLAMGTATASAQEVVHEDYEEVIEYSKNKRAVEPASLKENWFVNAGLGAQVYIGDHDRQAKVGARMAPALDVAFGRWINPGLGVRLMYSGLQARGATQDGIHSTGKPVPGKGGDGFWLEKQKFNLMNLHMDMMFNVTHLISGYNEERFWNVSPYVGIGWVHVYNRPKDNSLGGNFGVFNSFRINSAWNVNFDLRALLVTDELDGEGGNRRGEGMVSATIGVTYNFKPRGWKRIKTIIRYDNEQVNSLRHQLNEANIENARLKKELSKQGNKAE